MAIIRFNPFDPFEAMDTLFGEGTMHKNFTPAADVYEKKDVVVIEMPLAGVDPDDVNIHIENDVLTVSGETKRESEVDEKNYYRKEVREGHFYRTIPLPTHVDGEKANASINKGIVTITVPKKGEKKLTKIKIVKGKK